VIVTYDGTPTDALIADGTNPWVEVDGAPVDWTAHPGPRAACPCGEMGEVVLPGVLEAMDSAHGVARCDACSTAGHGYDGDLDAALALAKHVGGIVKYHTEED
jgi:hypothetical protein